VQYVVEYGNLVERGKMEAFLKNLENGMNSGYPTVQVLAIIAGIVLVIALIAIFVISVVRPSQKQKR